MAVTIQIDNDSNSAFGEDTGDQAKEVARILEALAEKIRDRDYLDDCGLYDINGNRVGECVIS